MFPAQVQVANYLIDYHRVDSDVILLVEGMTDVAAVYETGHPVALGCYKAGLSDAQAKLIYKYAPRRVLIGYDMDDAGDQAYAKALAKLSYHYPVQRLWWSDYKDLAAIPVKDRAVMLDEVIGAKSPIEHY